MPASNVGLHASASDFRLAFETDRMCPVKAWRTPGDVHVTLSGGRSIAAPLWRYRFLARLDGSQPKDIEPMNEEIWWPAVDDGISVRSMLDGRKSPGAMPPCVAAG